MASLFSENPAESVHVTQIPSETRLHEQSPILTHPGATSARATMAMGLGNLLASMLLLAPKPKLNNTDPIRPNLGPQDQHHNSLIFAFSLKDVSPYCLPLTVALCKLFLDGQSIFSLT